MTYLTSNEDDDEENQDGKVHRLMNLEADIRIQKVLEKEIVFRFGFFV